MSIETITSDDLNEEIVCNYFKNLVNQFFKILPMRESNEKSLPAYMESLRDELLGCKGLIKELNSNPSFLTLVNILQFLIDTPDCSVSTTKREVFKAIAVCNKLKDRYTEGGDVA